MNNILVVGGAGFIGSHMMKYLSQRGYQVTALDNLSTGYHDAVTGGELIQADLKNYEEVRDILKGTGFDGVMHFASSIEVGESVVNPRKYYENNVRNTLNLINAMMDQGPSNLIFSSSAAVYGNPRQVPIPETHALQPINPYGKSKAIIESVLEDYRSAYGFSATSLRYFNAAGADFDGHLGERHEPETHLIPLVIQAALGLRENIKIFGADYETPDGTCVRDYIHIEDLCRAHELALQQILGGSQGSSFNLGNGLGFSVKEVIEAVRKISGKPITAVVEGKRAGDPPMLIADATKAAQALGWKPKITSLDEIVESALRFYEGHYTSKDI